MTTDRQAYRIDPSNPGSDLAGETAAAMSAASIVFRRFNPAYSRELLSHAIQVSLTFSLSLSGTTGVSDVDAVCARRTLT